MMSDVGLGLVWFGLVGLGCGERGGSANMYGCKYGCRLQFKNSIAMLSLPQVADPLARVIYSGPVERCWLAVIR